MSDPPPHLSPPTPAAKPCATRFAGFSLIGLLLAGGGLRLALSTRKPAPSNSAPPTA
jgi:hypothetical protein